MNRKAPLKRSRGKAASAMERRHMDRVGEMGCLVCGGEATIHHVTGTINGPIPLEAGPRRSDQRVVPLCPVHHQKTHDPFHSLPQSVEALGHRGFYQEFGIDLFAEANRLWNETQERKAA